MLLIVKKSGTYVLITALLSTQFLFSAGSKAYADATETNVALGNAAVTTNGMVTNAVSLGKLVDGDRTTSAYALIDASTGPKWVQLDLGESLPITRVNVLNDYNNTAPRTGRDITIQLSNDATFATGVTTIFNNDADNSAGQGAGTDAAYVEPTDGTGKSITLSSPVSVRYVRSWANGHIRSSDGSTQTVNTPVELEVYTATPATNASLPSSVGLSAGTATVNSAVLSWTSPEPSAIAGYDIRFSTSPITAANWNNGLVVKRIVGEPAPAAATTVQTMTVKGLPSGVPVYFAMKTVGSSGEVSNLSSVASVSTKPVANIALGKTVASNATSPSNQPLSAATDGVKDRDKYVLYSVADGPKWVQVDLGKAYDIARINIRNDWGASGTYRKGVDLIVQTSNDPTFSTGVTTVFNNDGDNSSGLGAGTDSEYMELADGSGKDIFLNDTVNARYVRYWANGHIRTNGQLNLVDTPVEIEVYADPQDPVAPAAVSDLTSTFTSWKSVELSWTAPGDDGNTGTATSYDFRYSTSPLTEANWASAIRATGQPAPLAAGSSQSFTIGGLTPNTMYYFAMKTKDIVNESALSNVLSVTTLTSDTTAPAAIANLQVTRANLHSAKLTWTAPGNDGNVGTAAQYDVRYSTSPITEANWASAQQAIDELQQLAPGSAMQFKVKELITGSTYYFAVKTSDDVGNVSALSNVASAAIANPTPDEVTVSSLSALQQAIDNAPSSGRVITLAAGTYNQTTGIQINSKDNITIQGATSNYNDTVVKGPGIANTSLDINFKMYDSDYVTFKNMTIQDSNFHAIQVNDGSNYFHADNLKTWDNGEGGFKTTFSLTSGRGYSDFGVIENSAIGYTVSGVQSVVEGIDIIAGRGWIVRGNRIENTKTASGNGGYGVFAKANSIDTIIEDNVLVNNFIAISFGGGGSALTIFRNQDTTYEHRGGIIRNNVVYGTLDAGIYLNKAKDFKIANNTIMNTGSGVGAIEPRYAQTTGEIRNNLMTGAVKLREGGTATQSNNITGANSSWLVNPSGGDFHLHPYNGLDARDAGMTLADVPADIDGQARPYGSAYDVGADEFVPAETIPPATVANLTAGSATARSFVLTWNAPGDDGNVGTAYQYDIRYANAPITEANWSTAQKIESVPLPKVAGTSQSFTVSGPTAGATIYAAMKTADDQGNLSALSNVAQITMLASSGLEFTPTDDAYVALSGDRSHTSGSLITQNNGNSTYFSYIKANFTGFAGTTAEQATLKLYVSPKPNKPWAVTLYGLTDDSWAQSTIRNTNLPSETGAVTLGTLPVNLPGWYEFDVTDFVNSQMADKIATFKLHDPLAQGGSLYINSSDNAYNRLYLQVNSTDTAAPAAINDLAPGQRTMSSVELSWTAPGDDGNIRTASEYDVRYSTSPISEANWSSATPVVGEPTPTVAGTKMKFTVLGLTKGATYYFAMKTRDNANHESPLSNVIQVVMESTVNVALGKAASTNGTITNGLPISVITDGLKARDQYALISVADGPKWVQVDLSQAYPISRINVRNDWGADSTTYRTGRDHIVQLSNDPTFATGVTSVFNNDTDNSSGIGVGTDAEYQEPGDGSGKNITLAPPISARYVRFSANGHVRVNGQVNLVNTPVEIEVYADPGDSIPPAAVTNLSASNTTWKTTTLSWTAPGDDGSTGTAQSYDIRYHTAPLTEANWNDAVQLANEPAPLVAGTVQSMNVTGLPPGTALYFAMRSFDEAMNASALSNVLTVTTPATDPTPPGAIADLQAVAPNMRSVQLTWTAPGNDGNLGKAAGYDVRYSTSPITEANWASATQEVDELAQKNSGLAMKYQVNRLTTGTTYYFAVKTFDDAGNYSALSNVVSATTVAPTPDTVTVSSLSALQTAINNAPANGRIITLAAGTYSQTATIEITGKNNITIQGATANYDDTVIVGPGINSTVMDINFKVNDSDYVTFKNMTIRDSYYHAIQINSGSDYFHADHLKTWDNGEGGFKSTGSTNLEQPYADYGLIETSMIGYTTSGMRGSVEGIDLIASKGWIIRGNTFMNAKRTDNSPGYAFFAKGNSMDTVVENNIFKNSAVAMSFGGGGTAPEYFRFGDTSLEHRGGIMRNNVVFGTYDTAVYMNKAADFKVYNNTMLGIAPGVAVGGIESRFAGSGGEIRNNLMDKAVKLRDGGLATQSDNIANAGSSWLVNPAAGDFHLNPSTAQGAIDTGYALPVDVPTDMDGQSRPIGSAYDIGADEYGSVPEAPTGLSASATSAAVQLGWNASTGATSYNVKRGSVSGGPYTTIASGVTGATYTDSTVSNGFTYYYVVSAVTGSIESANSAQASASPTSGAALSRSGWTAAASATTYSPSLALDGNAATRWTTSRSQIPGLYYQVNMGSAKTFNKLTLDSTGGSDFPASYEVYVSSDGTNWGTAVASGTGSGNIQTVTFPIQTASYIKVVLTGTKANWWSIYEFNVYEP
ncbi:fibronectin type III domain-containing protein [Paenibacillus cymbidii]|uniref:fibronectin type III domain-containing protein n=1 Tax=Paenibacillus cymbidii TaxID=1639034 RepID=UPI001081E451|nr:discoidin domain-containing protein [Paenibacillus cymbidii]